MLKITKGLKPFVEEGITSYIDDKGNEYVRVKVDKEDFCITLYDHHKDDRYRFNWVEMTRILKDYGLTTFTTEQAELYRKHRDEINTKLKEMGGDALKDEYWTIEESGNEYAWFFSSVKDYTDVTYKNVICKIRPILNL